MQQSDQSDAPQCDGEHGLTMSRRQSLVEQPVDEGEDASAPAFSEFGDADGARYRKALAVPPRQR